MKFVKEFDKHTRGRMPTYGSIIIRDGMLNIRIHDNTVHCVKIGRTEKGIGVVVEKDDVKRKTPIIFTTYKYEESDIPENFQGETYVFKIPGEKLSDTEYEFKFCNAKMLNKK